MNDEYKKSLSHLSDEELKVEYKKQKDAAEHFDLVQMSQKISLNSCYGSLGNKYSRFYDLRLATSITMMGQLAIQYVAHGINEIFNKLLETEEYIDFVAYIDTDSVHINAKPIVDKLCVDSSHEETLKFLQKTGKQFEKIADSELARLGKILNADVPFAFTMECEGISDKAIWTGKKRYVQRVCGDSSSIYSTPKEKIMGLEIKRSSTPDAVKPMLEQCIKHMLDGDVDKFREYIDECRKEFYSLPVEEIAFPRGVSDITKYECKANLYKKGTPIAVKAGIVYNHMIDKLGLQSKYSKITDGSKIKFIYLNEPNTVHERVIGFNNSIPKEFEIEDSDIDKKTQFEKTFLDPVKSITECIGWELEETATLF